MQRLRAGTVWEEQGLVFTQPTGRPIDPRSDWAHWKALLWTEARMLSRYQHVVDELRRDAADRMGEALWPGEKLRPTETRT